MDRHGFKQQYGPWAIIAGASTGIGKSFSEQLAAKGFNLVMLALPDSGTETLAQQLQTHHPIRTRVVELDLASPDAVTELTQHTADLDIGLLVYVACHSVIGRFLETSIDDKLKIIDVNIRAPLLLAAHFAPQLQARGKGGILLMSSMSGWQGTSMVATYAASKAFNTVFAEGLWRELAASGIDVLGLVAGATHTPTFDQLTPSHQQRSVMPMQPDAVVREALANLGKKPTHIAGFMNRVVAFVTNRFLSRRSAIRFISTNTERVYQSK